MEAIKAGASGYLFKNLNAAEFFDLLEDLAQGEAPLAPGLAARLLRELTLAGATELPPLPTNSESEHQLNARQVEVLRLVARGLTYKEVGNTLSISERTVRYHMDEIIKRLHVGSRTEAIAYAARLSAPT